MIPHDPGSTGTRLSFSGSRITSRERCLWRLVFRAFVLMLILASMTGCAQLALYPEGPLDSKIDCWSRYVDHKASEEPPDQQGVTLADAVGLARATRKSYERFLLSSEHQQLAGGALAVGLTGSALGLATSGGHTATAAALGAGPAGYRA